MLDLTLAVAHHLLIFGIFGIFCVEFWAVRPGAARRFDGFLVRRSGRGHHSDRFLQCNLCRQGLALLLA